MFIFVLLKFSLGLIWPKDIFSRIENIQEIARLNMFIVWNRCFGSTTLVAWAPQKQG